MFSSDNSTTATAVRRSRAEARAPPPIILRSALECRAADRRPTCDSTGAQHEEVLHDRHCRHHRRRGVRHGRRRGVSGQAGAIHHPVRAGRRIRPRRAAAGAGVPGEVQAGDDRHQQARRGRRARLVADEQHAGGRLYDRRRQSPAHRAAAARARHVVEDRGHHACLLLSLHAGRDHRCGRQPVQDVRRPGARGARETRGRHHRRLGHEFGEPRRDGAARPGDEDQDDVRAVQRYGGPPLLRPGRTRVGDDVLFDARDPAEGQDADAGRRDREALPQFPDVPTFRELG